MFLAQHYTCKSIFMSQCIFFSLMAACLNKPIIIIIIITLHVTTWNSN